MKATDIIAIIFITLVLYFAVNFGIVSLIYAILAWAFDPITFRITVSLAIAAVLTILEIFFTKR